MTRERGSFPYAFDGSQVKQIFKNEIGSHRWQRIPPTERKGRVQTSTITVAILDVKEYIDLDIQPHEVTIEYTRGKTKAGGQHLNTTDSCVVITHNSTGLKVVRNGRNQHQNKASAMEEMKKRVNNFYRTGHDNIIVEERRGQIGNGERSDKRRTYNDKQNLVVDHVTGKSATLKDILKGKIDLLA